MSLALFVSMLAVACATGEIGSKVALLAGAGVELLLLVLLLLTAGA